MANLIRHSLLACGFAMAATTLCVPTAFAAEAKKPVKAKSRAKAKAPIETEALTSSVQEDEPDVTDKNSVEYNCELGNKVTIYNNDADPTTIALRWKKRLHRLLRIGTTTGAQRFENTNFGLTWIGIPSKGMLLDSKLNRQLANECKNAEQENPVVVTPTKPDLIAPIGKVIVEPAIPPAALAPPVLPLTTPAIPATPTTPPPEKMPGDAPVSAPVAPVPAAQIVPEPAPAPAVLN